MIEATEQDRAAFEAWISKPPFEYSTAKFGNGEYVYATVGFAWKAWQEAQAKMQARVAELEAEKWNTQIAEAALLSVEKERDGLLSQLPEGMKHCTIIFKECDKGHGWLTATNWVQHGCPKCEFDRIVDEKHELQRLRRQSSNMVSALHLEACQWRLKAEKAEQERDGLAAKLEKAEESLSGWREGCTGKALARIKADAVREACKFAAGKALTEGWYTIDSNDLLEYANHIEGGA